MFGELWDITHVLLTGTNRAGTNRAMQLSGRLQQSDMIDNWLTIRYNA